MHCTVRCFGAFDAFGASGKRESPNRLAAAAALPMASALLFASECVYDPNFVQNDY